MKKLLTILMLFTFNVKAQDSSLLVKCFSTLATQNKVIRDQQKGLEIRDELILNLNEMVRFQDSFVLAQFSEIGYLKNRNSYLEKLIGSLPMFRKEYDSFMKPEFEALHNVLTKDTVKKVFIKPKKHKL